MGGIGENDNKGEGGLDVKFNTYWGGGITFSFVFANWKSSGRVIRVQITCEILTLEYIKLTNLSTLGCSDL